MRVKLDLLCLTPPQSAAYPGYIHHWAAGYSSAEVARVQYIKDVNRYKGKIISSMPVEPVTFKTVKPPKDFAPRFNCPPDIWILVDLHNARLDDPNQPVHVLIFRRRIDARNYLRAWKAGRAHDGSIKARASFSDPIHLWQH